MKCEKWILKNEFYPLPFSRVRPNVFITREFSYLFPGPFGICTFIFRVLPGKKIYSPGAKKNLKNITWCEKIWKIFISGYYLVHKNLKKFSHQVIPWENFFPGNTLRKFFPGNTLEIKVQISSGPGLFIKVLYF